MESIVFLFDIATFRTQAGNPTTGAIWIEIGGRPHPERGWRDFPLVITSWWLRAIRELEAGAGSRSLDFMDGRCPLVLRRIEGDRISAEGWNQSRRLFSAEVSLAEIAEKLRRMAAELEAASGERLTA